LVCRLEASQEAAEANREDVLEATKQKARAVSERCELVLSAQKLKKEALAHSIEAKLEAAEAQRQVSIPWLSPSYSGRTCAGFLYQLTCLNFVRHLLLLFFACRLDWPRQ
jgi:hypothetical protein